MPQRSVNGRRIARIVNARFTCAAGNVVARDKGEYGKAGKNTPRSRVGLAAACCTQLLG
jgi:hypothetical protein